MPNVKLIYTCELYIDEYTNRDVITDESLPWEEVTDEELKLLLDFQWKIPTYKGLKASIIVQADKGYVTKTVKSLKDWLRKEQEEKEAARLKAEAKKKAVAKKKQESERAVFEKLKKKYGEKAQ